MLLKFIIGLIHLYKSYVSPFLPQSCLYACSCSSFSMSCFQKYGIILGFFLSIKRIISCNYFLNHQYKEVI
ncbi:MAG: membrane protein insertion efficiency factor YidD [Candidatus Marinimicrobia bacterium]|nr:membrane protein insertion efficiency factor YidD [Candidatus Neomarinimicrobiota bacterium]